MNPHQKPQEDVVVTQEDREAAYALLIQSKDTLTVSERACLDEMRQGQWDQGSAAQAFARHRLLGHEAGRRDMREAAGKENAEAVSRIVLAYHAAICCPKGVVPDDEIYDPDLAKTIQAAMDAGIPMRSRPTEPLGGESPPDNSGPE